MPLGGTDGSGEMDANKTASYADLACAFLESGRRSRTVLVNSRIRLRFIITT